MLPSTLKTVYFSTDIVVFVFRVEMLYWLQQERRCEKMGGEDGFIHFNTIANSNQLTFDDVFSLNAKQARPLSCDPVHGPRRDNKGVGNVAAGALASLAKKERPTESRNNVY